MIEIVKDLDALRKVSKKTTKEDAEKLDIVNKIKEAMQNTWTEGFGLAAIQVGIPLRFGWFTFKGREYTLINPAIVTAWEENLHGDEGCLSLPHVRKHVKRFFKIEYLNDGKLKRAKGMLAIIIQHEVDHMNGILTIDKEEVKFNG